MIAIIFNQKNVFGVNSFYFNLLIRFEKTRESIYLRSYKKLDRVLAEIGGIAKALMLIGFFICMPINKLKLHQQISNTLFYFGKKEKNQQKSEQKIDGLKLIQIIEDSQNQNRLQQEQICSIQQGLISNQQIQKKDSIFKLNHSVNTHNNVEDNDDFLESQRNKTPDMSINLYSQDHINTQSKNLATQNIEKLQAKQSSNESHQFENSNQKKQNFISIFQQIQKQKDEVNSLDDSQTSREMASVNLNQNEQTKRSSKINLIQIIKQNQQKVKDKQRNTKKSKKILQHDKTKIQQSIMNIKKKVFQNNENEQVQELKFSWSDYIKYYIWPFGKFVQKKKQIDYSIKNIYKHLDVLYIVQKLLELEKIKQLLDENQIKLLQFFPKPVIDVDDLHQQDGDSNKKNQIQPQLKIIKSKSINILNRQLDENDKTKEAFQALKNIIEKERLTDIDKKIIEMLDETILDDISKNVDYFEELEDSPEDAISQDNYTQNIENNEKNNVNINGEQQIPQNNPISYNSPLLINQKVFSVEFEKTEINQNTLQNSQEKE